MNEHDLVPAGALFLGTSVITLFLVALAPRLGLVDDASDARDRKHHVRAVPLVGGTALALALLVWVRVEGVDVVGGHVVGGIAFAPRAVVWALAIAFLTGLIDDVLPRGLGPIAKITGQASAGLALAGGLLVDGEHASFTASALAVLAAIVAQNAANTFDNADGALTAVASVGFVLVSPFVGATLAFLPWCLLRVGGTPILRGSGATTPRAWLGDSGSHLLGILLLTTPVAWAALALPLADLLRVIFVRTRAGDPIWVGDRRHLAHELQARGFSPVRVVLVLVALALPCLVLVRVFAA